MPRVLLRGGVATLVLALVLGAFGLETASLVASLCALLMTVIALARDGARHPAPVRPRRLLLCHGLLVVAMGCEVIIVSAYPLHWAAGAAVFAAWMAGVTHWSRRLPLPS